MAGSSTPGSNTVRYSSNSSASNIRMKLVESQQKVHPSIKQDYAPGSAGSYAHDWSTSGTGSGIKTSGRHLLDDYGRVCGLRGVNLSGSSKTPVNHVEETFFHDHRTVSFVGRPFALSEAPTHFARLRRWGLTFIRFMVTWEALEHAGPGQYDQDYLSYLHAIISLLPQFGLTALVSMHQDVWSRFSGGSGAPAWTLELVGFDIAALEETGAAYLGGVKQPGVELDRGRWPTGYQKLAASTMSTVFWAGQTFAPNLMLQRGEKKVNAQAFLQEAFLSCYEWMVTGLRDLPGILGFEMMNEPHRGYISLPSMHNFDYRTDLHLNDIPSALQSFLLGAGYPTRVPHWTRSFPMPTRLTSHHVRNLKGAKVWRADGPTGGRCLWEMHGVWRYDTKKKEGIVLKESYFVKRPSDGHKIDWYIDCWFPFVKQWSERVHAIAGDKKLIFVEAIPNEFCPSSWTPEHQPRNMVFAPHWYDLNALFLKGFSRFTVNVQALSRGVPFYRTLHWGHRSTQENYALQLRNLVEAGYKALGERPVIIGETGIPMDMNEKEAFTTGNFVWQERMMDALITGLDRCLVGFTLWNYNPDNTDSHGDFWNGENFSWFSAHEIKPSTPLSLEQTNEDLDNGGRILRSVVRPYPAKVAGIPTQIDYDLNTGTFTFKWRTPTSASPELGAGQSSGAITPPLGSHPTVLARETEIFMPHSLTKGRRLILNYNCNTDEEAECDWKHDVALQTLFVVPEDAAPGSLHMVEVTFDPPLEERFPLDASVWRDFAHIWIPALIGLLSIFVFFFVRLTL